MYKKRLILFFLTLFCMTSGYAFTQYNTTTTTTTTTSSPSPITSKRAHHHTFISSPTTPKSSSSTPKVIHHQKNTHAKHKSSSTTTLHLPPFSAINVTGPVHIILMCQQEGQSVTVLAPPTVAEFVNASVQNHTLMIDPHFREDQRVGVSIRVNMTQPLRNLETRGSSSVSMTNCGNPNLVVTARDSSSVSMTNSSNPNLVVTAHDSASVHLKGRNTLHALYNDSTNALVVDHAYGKNFILCGSSNGGRIVISGKTDELNAKLHGSVLLDARGLEARSIHLLTHDNAAAYVCPTEVLYGFAYDYSNIYYYGHPQRVMKDTNASGNVLKVVSWGR